MSFAPTYLTITLDSAASDAAPSATSPEFVADDSFFGSTPPSVTEGAGSQEEDVLPSFRPQEARHLHPRADCPVNTLATSIPGIECREFYRLCDGTHWEEWMCEPTYIYPTPTDDLPGVTTAPTPIMTTTPASTTHQITSTARPTNGAAGNAGFNPMGLVPLAAALYQGFKAGK